MPDDDQSPPIPLSAFGATLRPQLTGTSTVRSRQPSGAEHTIRSYSQGHPDEIWLKLLAVRHGIERHTAAEWHALIAQYKHAPAHPADPAYQA